jgi:protein-S-isoprenylcysteine O-methyltransferase Ste14
MTTTSEKERIKQKLAAIKGFYVHAAVFVGVIAILFIVNATSTGPWWVHWVFLGWGLGLAGHAALILGRLPRSFKRWEARKMKELIEAEKLDRN